MRLTVITTLSYYGTVPVTAIKTFTITTPVCCLNKSANYLRSSGSGGDCGAAAGTAKDGTNTGALTLGTKTGALTF